MANIVFSAGDPNSYAQTFPSQVTAPAGSGVSPITGVDSDSDVLSLQPDSNLLNVGQIVPFLIQVTADTDGDINITAGWDTEATNSNPFGYGSIIAAFVDTGDAGDNDDGNATATLGAVSEIDNQLQAPITVSGLTSGETAIVEVWAVLDDVQDTKTGTIQAEIIEASDPGGVVQVGNQTIPVNVNNVAVCFLPGTLVATENGECPVERLQIGDLVKTAEGKLEPVKWIGRQTIDPTAPLHPFRARPIQIKAGALGESLPKRDLYTSPDHALLVDGLLVNAGALENGTSIVSTQPKETFVYYHIELEQHSLIIAEGSYTESFLPQLQDRSTFDNGNEYEELYPNHNILSLLPMSFPRVSSKRQLPRSVAKQLAKVAETLHVEVLAAR